MKIGVEATSFENKITGTNRYITCLLEQLENSPNEIIKCFPQNRQFSNFNDGKTVSSLKRHLYRNFLLSKDLKNYGADCAIFPDYFMPSDFEKPSAVVIHDLSFISHPQFYSARFVRYYNYKIKKTLKKTPFIIAVSEHTKRNITKYQFLSGLPFCWRLFL